MGPTTPRSCSPFPLLRGVLSPLPLGRAAALVVKSEVAAGEPPLDHPSERRSPAPAVGRTAAFSVARIVDSLDEGSLHA